MNTKNRFGVVLFLMWLGCQFGCSAENNKSVPTALLPQFAEEPEPIPAKPKPTVIVVRPRGWQDAIADWEQYRSIDYSIRYVDSLPSATEQHVGILQAIAESESAIAAIVLCGDVAVPISDDGIPIEPSSAVKSYRNFEPLTATFTVDTAVKLGEFTTPTLSTDVLFGDTDDDGCPDIAVGRLPAKTPSQLTRMLQKSIDYERAGIGEWRDKIHVTAGIGGFGVLADTAIEGVARRFLTDGIPDHFQLNTTHANLSSVYCPDPLKMRESFVNRINQGGLFWVYIGHGNITHLDHYQVGKHWLPICNAEHVGEFDISQGAPIALLLACFTGAIDARADCFAERLLELDHGPVAVIAGSRVTMPYGMSEIAGELMEACFEEKLPTLGAIVLKAKREVWNTSASGVTDDADESTGVSMSVRQKYHDIITRMAAALSPEGHDLQAERREHVRLLNLLGDPLLKVRHARPLTMQCAEQSAPGETVHIAGESPLSGTMTIALRLMRDRVPDGVTGIGTYTGSDQQREQMQSNYEAANNLVLSSVSQKVKRGKFEIDFVVPSNAKGRCVLSVQVTGKSDWAVGSQRITIRRNKS
jgi:hypothetical protein